MTVAANYMLKYIQTMLSCNTTDHSYNSMLRVEEFNRSRCNVSLSFVDPGMMSLRVLYIQAKCFSEGGFNIKMPFYHNGNYHYKDKLVSWSHYLNNRNPYLDRWALYWSTCILSVWPESQAPQVPVPEDRGPRLQACGTWMGTIWLSEGVGGRGNCRRLTAGMECVIVWEATTGMECVIVWEATICMECVIVWEATTGMECVIVWEATICMECVIVWEATTGMECVIVWEATICMECVIVCKANTATKCVIVWEATICMECVIVWEATTGMEFVIVLEATICMECVIVCKANTAMECVIVWKATTVMVGVIVWDSTTGIECAIVWEATACIGVWSLYERQLQPWNRWSSWSYSFAFL